MKQQQTIIINDEIQLTDTIRFMKSVPGIYLWDNLFSAGELLQWEKSPSF